MRRSDDVMRAVLACRLGRGPLWIRTTDLTVISRALSPTELKAHETSAETAAVSLGPLRGPGAAGPRPLKSGATNRKSRCVGASSLRQGTEPRRLLCADSHCPLAGLPDGLRHRLQPSCIPVLLRRCPEGRRLLFAVLLGRLTADLS
jgi:hypothetical protein